MTTVLVSHIHGQTERHLRARANWPADSILRSTWGRDATSIGNDRPLPFLRDLLQAGLDSGADVVAITNDDCSLGENALPKMARHCQVFDFGCVRRDPKHCGREAFFFLAEWLREYLPTMPDVILCAERWDLVIARWLHKLRGQRLSEHNWLQDLFPTEVEPGLVQHESHVSFWTAEKQRPAAQHNLRLWKQLA